MANELYFDIKLALNDSDERTVKERLNNLQRDANEASQGSASAKQKETKATQAQANAEKELIKEFQRKVTLNEVQFRQGILSQKAALQQSEVIERQAIEQGILTDATLQGVRAQKTMFLSQQRISTGFTGLASTSARANQSLMNLGRIVQDLPFGFLGISNNIDPALDSFNRLKEESGGVGGALKALLGSLKGSGGLIFALGSVLPSAILIAQQGWNMYSKSTKKAKEEANELLETVKSLSGEILDLDDINKLNTSELLESASATNILATRFQKYVQLLHDRGFKELAKTYREQSEELRKQADETARRREELVRIIQVQTRLTESEIKNRFANISNNETQVEQLKVLQEQYQLYLEQDELLLRESDAREKLLQAQKDEIRLKRRNLQLNFDMELISREELGLENKKLDNELLRLHIQQQRLALKKEEHSLVIPDIQIQQTLVEDAELQEALRRQEQQKINRLNILQQLDFKTRLAHASDFERERLMLVQERINNTNKLTDNGMTQEEARKRAMVLFDAQMENLKTKKVEEEEKRKAEIRQQYANTSFAMMGSFLSSLSQLNQSQTDETEVQARKKFETQKKLSKAQAVVNGAAAIVKTYQQFGFPAGIPFAMAQAAATLVQLRAIENTEFNSASTSQRASSETKQTGFFTTERGENKNIQRPINNQPINVYLEGEFDDEVVSVKARRGDQKRKRATFFTV